MNPIVASVFAFVIIATGGITLSAPPPAVQPGAVRETSHWKLFSPFIVKPFVKTLARPVTFAGRSYVLVETKRVIAKRLTDVPDPSVSRGVQPIDLCHA